LSGAPLVEALWVLSEPSSGMTAELCLVGSAFGYYICYLTCY
jgi:hypothetical protein